MQTLVVLPVVFLAAFGLFAQCVANLKAKRAAFLAFPVGLFLLMSNPMWAWLALLTQDWILLGIMITLGVPNIWLSLQFFEYEWPQRRLPMAGEEKLAIFLVVSGLVLLGLSYRHSGLTQAVGFTGAYFTCCLMIYSFVMKLWKVSRGEQTLDGLKWVTLVTLALLYAVMIFYGQNNNIPLLTVAYIFAEGCCLLAMGYKLLAAHPIRPKGHNKVH